MLARIDYDGRERSQIEVLRSERKRHEERASIEEKNQLGGGSTSEKVLQYSLGKLFGRTVPSEKHIIVTVSD